MARRRRHLLVVVAAGLVLAACGSEEIKLQDGESAEIRNGAEVFQERCAGCHTLQAVGSEGSAVAVNDRERVDGPNFNTRKEEADQVLYAIRNGGFSGAIMPENIVTGKEAENVAAFLEKYSGLESPEASQ